MKDEKVCTWCNRTGHHANHCPDPKPEYGTDVFGRGMKVVVQKGTGRYMAVLFSDAAKKKEE